MESVGREESNRQPNAEFMLRLRQNIQGGGQQNAEKPTFVKVM
jgi:hypothetical protein